MSCIINNILEPGQANEFYSINPSNQEIIWQGKTANLEQVTRAVISAKKAFPSWSKLSLEQRLTYIESYNKLLEMNSDRLANLMSDEMGKNLSDAKLEVKIMLGKFSTALNAYKERTGIQEKEVNGSISLTKHKAHGVCAVFGPYNFPGHIPNGHIIPALIAGNTIVFKPSNFVPQFSEEWIKLFIEASFPEGVVNMVQGEAQTGEYLSKSDDINALFFTGSSRVGEILHKNFAGKLDKVLALELGGNNALVIDNGSNLEEVVEIAINSAFVSNGQRCTCTRRIILIDQDGFADKFISAFIDKTKKLEIDLPQAGKFLSCLISKEQVDLILKKQEDFIRNGAKALLEAQKHNLGEAFITPGIIEIKDYDEDEEIFGPFVKIYKALNLEHAIRIANNTRYGLAASIVTNNHKHFEVFYNEIKTGLINWNAPTTGAMGIAPFGGTGLSGNHRPSGYYAADYCAYPVASVINKAKLDY
jgi:succinylglutamic semialdehyde dehydrogenase